MNKGFTIFGGSGDLTYRKLLPALFKMSLSNDIDNSFAIIAVGRRDFSREEYIEIARRWIQEFALEYTEDRFQEFAARLDYFQLDIENPKAYQRLKEYYKNNSIKDHVYYFAVAPRLFLPITEGLKIMSCANNCKVIVEKPFGETLKAAKELNTMMENVFLKENIYHIDHYLGKEMIQSIQTIRFKNAIFKGIWNHEYIENIQISAFERVGVENRGGYYDESGALRDMVQNHLFQVLSLIAMEPPKKAGSKAIHDAQLAVLKALRPLPAQDIQNHVILGQYEGYLDEPKVAENSKTETYAALKLFVDNKRWKNVPFYIRTGKKLAKRETEVVIQFKRVDKDVAGNVLIIKIQPEEGVYLQFNTKRPGKTFAIDQVSMDFCQSCNDHARLNTPEAYERLLTACLQEDRSLFSMWDTIEVSWNFMDDLIQKFRESKKPLMIYEVNSNGPKLADHLLSSQDHFWFELKEQEDEE